MTCFCPGAPVFFTGAPDFFSRPPQGRTVCARGPAWDRPLRGKWGRPCIRVGAGVLTRPPRRAPPLRRGGLWPPVCLPPTGGKVPPKGADEGAIIDRFRFPQGRFRRLRAATYFAHGGSSSQSPLDSVSAWWRKLRLFPCSSSSRRTHFVGLRREVRERLPKTPPRTAPDEHFVLIVAHPTPSGPSGHLPLTGGVGPGPLFTGVTP